MANVIRMERHGNTETKQGSHSTASRRDSRPAELGAFKNAPAANPPERTPVPGRITCADTKRQCEENGTNAKETTAQTTVRSERMKSVRWQSAPRCDELLALR